jgi:hypothetical protein
MRRAGLMTDMAKGSTRFRTKVQSTMYTMVIKRRGMWSLGGESSLPSLFGDS